MNSSSSLTSMASQLDELGFCIIADAVPAGTLDDLTRSMEVLAANDSTVRAAGTRNLTELVPSVARIAGSPEIATLLEYLGTTRAFLVRSIFFDKQSGANWKVPWHQDLTIAVRKRNEVPGFGSWSVKAGIPHVRPPASVLERMITLRLHLDDCDASNGALKVLPETHRAGILSAGQIQQRRHERDEIVCAVPRGGILAMRPLLLHASARALQPTHRRVIHLEFATDDLPDGLEWFE